MSPTRGPYSSPAQTERRLRILHTTLELLRVQGPSGVTLKKVSEGAGVSLKTLHNIYGGREELLVKAASLEIDAIQISEQVTRLEAGIPQLLSFTTAVMEKFEESPEFMKTILGVVFRSDDDQAMSETRIRHIHETAVRALEAAEANGELREGTDVDVLANMISGNQWGAVFLWIRDLITLEQFTQQTLVNHCVTLIPYCVGARKAWLETKLEELLAVSADQSAGAASVKTDRLTPTNLTQNREGEKEQ